MMNLIHVLKRQAAGSGMKRLVLVMCLYTARGNLYSESVYTYDLKKDSIISTLSLGMAGGSYLLPVTITTIPHDLNINDVNLFDRGFMFPKDGTLIDVRNLVRYGIPVLPILSPLSVCIGGGGGGYKEKS